MSTDLLSELGASKPRRDARRLRCFSTVQEAGSRKEGNGAVALTVWSPASTRHGTVNDWVNVPVLPTVTVPNVVGVDAMLPNSPLR